MGVRCTGRFSAGDELEIAPTSIAFRQQQEKSNRLPWKTSGFESLRRRAPLSHIGQRAGTFATPWCQL